MLTGRFPVVSQATAVCAPCLTASVIDRPQRDRSLRRPGVGVLHPVLILRAGRFGCGHGLPTRQVEARDSAPLNTKEGAHL